MDVNDSLTSGAASAAARGLHTTPPSCPDAASSCVFCDIVTGKAPAQIVGPPMSGVVMFKPLNPVTKGHTLVVPKHHAARPEDDELGALAATAAAMQLGRTYCGDYNLIVSVGAYATQTIGHTHFHFVPRTKNDGLALPWSSQVPDS